MTEDDEAAFDEFLAARGTSLLRTAILVCGATRHDAEDLVQHALEKGLPALAADQARQPRGVREEDRPERRHQPGATTEDHQGDLLRPAARDRRRLSRPGSARHPHQGITQIAPKMRAVLVLRYWEDQPETATAALLGCSVGSVKSQAARGLARIRANMTVAEDVAR